MKKLKIGDRVAIYSMVEGLGRITGRVVDLDGSVVTVRRVTDKKVQLWEAHRKQCRKLVPRIRSGAV